MTSAQSSCEICRWCLEIESLKQAPTRPHSAVAQPQNCVHASLALRSFNSLFFLSTASCSLVLLSGKYFQGCNSVSTSKLEFLDVDEEEDDLERVEEVEVSDSRRNREGLDSASVAVVGGVAMYVIDKLRNNRRADNILFSMTSIFLF